MEPASDLVARLLSREPGAFDEAYDAYRPRLFAYLLRSTGRREVAEDLLQETWLRLAAHSDRLRPDTCLPAWLFTVARNLALSHQRARGRDAGRTGELGALALSADDDASPYEEAVASELQRRVAVGLARLPETDRDTLLLVAVAGLEPTQAAAACGVKPEAMRQRLARARARLGRLVAGSLAGEARAGRRDP